MCSALACRCARCHVRNSYITVVRHENDGSQRTPPRNTRNYEASRQCRIHPWLSARAAWPVSPNQSLPSTQDHPRPQHPAPRKDLDGWVLGRWWRGFAYQTLAGVAERLCPSRPPRRSSHIPSTRNCFAAPAHTVALEVNGGGGADGENDDECCCDRCRGLAPKVRRIAYCVAPWATLRWPLCDLLICIHSESEPNAVTFPETF